MKNVKYGKCVRCGKTYEATPDLTNCESKRQAIKMRRSIWIYFTLTLRL